MVLAQLIQGKDGKYTWNMITDDDADIIEIQTWKGMYTIPKPELLPTIMDAYAYCEDVPFWSGLDWPSTCYAYSPHKQQWLQYNGTREDALSKIQADTLAWVLAQPPQLDQMKAAYEIDRESVEKEFTEIVHVIISK